MKLSTKSRYGLRALLAIARKEGYGSVSRKIIADEEGISRGYLENILSTLRDKGIIRTTRGINGGFELNKTSADITLLDIVSSLEGPIAPVDCIENSTICEKSGRCAAQKAWNKLYEAEMTALESMTLKDILEMEKDVEAISPDYFI